MIDKCTHWIDIINTLGKYSLIGRALDCDSRGCRFNSYYLPMNTCYNLMKFYTLNPVSKTAILTTLYTPTINFKNKIKVKIWKTKTKSPIVINKKTNIINISKPKNQFYFTFFNGINYNYSSGMIIKSLKLETRSIRRTKAGFYLFFSFFLKKFTTLKQSNTNLIIFLKNFNKINILKKFLLKFFNKNNLLLILSVSKNFNLKNYKKVSFINKRLRRKYPIE